MKTAIIALSAASVVVGWTCNALAQPTERSEARPEPARAESDGRTVELPDPAKPEVRTDASWSTTDDVFRVAEGETAWKSRIVMPGDFGTWVHAPLELGPISVPIIGGEMGLTSRLSLIAEGAKDGFDQSFSGANAGLRLHLFSAESPLQMSVAGGVTRDLPVTVDQLQGTSSAWAQLRLSRDAGPWHWSGALRASAPVADARLPPTLMGSAGVSRDVGSTRVGLEYAFEGAQTSRSAILAWIMLLRLNQRMMLRAGAAMPLTGGAPASVSLSVTGNF